MDAVLLSFLPGAIRGPQIVEFLKVLRHHIPEPMLIVWDGLRAHKSNIVRDHVEADGDIQIEFLPAYAPELNPTEYIWVISRHERSPTCAHDILSLFANWPRDGCARCSDARPWCKRSGSRLSWPSDVTVLCKAQ